MTVVQTHVHHVPASDCPEEGRPLSHHGCILDSIR